MCIKSGICVVNTDVTFHANRTPFFTYMFTLLLSRVGYFRALSHSSRVGPFSSLGSDVWILSRSRHIWSHYRPVQEYRDILSYETLMKYSIPLALMAILIVELTILPRFLTDSQIGTHRVGSTRGLNHVWCSNDLGFWIRPLKLDKLDAIRGKSFICRWKGVQAIFTILLLTKWTPYYVL